MKRGSRPATLTDVAQFAGVSPSTVSNVVRGSDVVAARTRRRVLNAITELGYRPNALARNLLRGRATTVGIIARDLRNPFFAEMASLVEREVAGFGFAAMFCATDGDPDREEQAVELMLDHRVTGLIILSFLSHADLIATRINEQIPVVFVAAEEPWADSVTVDEHRGGEIVARHLIGLGHRRLAFIGPLQPDRADARRLEGFLRAAADAGLRPTVIAWDPPDGQPSVDGVAVEWGAILSGSAPLTGIFAANDFAAIDLLDVADALGVRVPEALSVVGFDDVDMARLRRINLTTVSQPRAALVRLGVGALLGRIEGRISGDPHVTLASVGLTVRGSTAPPPR
ncbi:MAG: LacI family transcriptional regulator [Chloroflexota bacterium]|jgi:LacI family transcriptional regulator|nr:LacI family transcriptional regulator [Chloroflexota bacterium]